MDTNAALLRQYHFEDNTIRPAHVGWPLKWFATRYNKKHVFNRGDLARADSLRFSLNQFKNRMRWRYHLRGEPPDASSPSGIWRALRALPTPECPHPFAPELNAWVNHLEDIVTRTFYRGRSSAARTRSHVNVIPLDLFALRLLKENDCTFVPFDKEAGFCVITHSDYKKVQQSILDGPSYAFVGDANLCIPGLESGYNRMCTIVSKYYKQPFLKNQLMRSLRSRGGMYDSKLIMTLKSHKKVPEFRNIHSCPQSAFAGLSWWVTGVLEGIISEYSHIIKSNDTFRRDVANMSFPASAEFLRIDAKSFFMSGSPKQLAHDASSLVKDDEPRGIVALVLLWLLENQIIESDDKELPLFRVVQCCSGMGLAHSSAIANAAFIARADLWLISKATMNAFGILYYGRYCDDLVFISTVPRRLHLLVSSLSYRLAPVFNIEVVERSATTVEMLAFRLYIQGSVVHHEPRRIDMAVPLSSDSAHPPRVHRWPLWYFRSMHRLCSEPHNVGKFQKLVADRFSRSFCSDRLWELLQKEVENGPDKAHKPAPRLAGPDTEADRLWLVLDFHPSWNSVSLQRVVSEFAKDPWWRSLYRAALGRYPEIRLSWRVTSPRLIGFSRLEAARTRHRAV